MAAGRPRPPSEILEDLLSPHVIPAKDLCDWVISNFIDEDGPLYNEDHFHLQEAYLGFLWTNTTNKRRGRSIIGMAEEPVFRCGKWQKIRQEIQIIEWFGVIPDFLVTLDANWCAQATDTEFAALIDHELYHCAQAIDEFGMPKFDRDTGKPKLTLKGHDVEEFIGVVRRYGTGGEDSQLSQLVRAANSSPEISHVRIAKSCGTCIGE